MISVADIIRAKVYDIPDDGAMATFSFPLSSYQVGVT